MNVEINEEINEEKNKWINVEKKRINEEMNVEIDN